MGDTAVTPVSDEERFETAWNGAVQPRLAAIEQERLKVRNRILIAWLGILSIGLPLLAGVHHLGWGRDPFALVFTGIIVGIGVVWGLYFHKFRERFKRELVGSLIKAFDERLSYSPNDSISMEEFKQSGLVREHPVTGYDGEDLIQGKIGATRIRFSEISASSTSDVSTQSGIRVRRGSKNKTLFRGVLFIADFNKHFAGSTYVLPDRAQRWLGGAGQSLQGLGSSYGELVKLEDPEFERFFAVFSTSQIEARYILSAALMARLTDFRRQHGHLLRVGFVDSHLYLGIQIKRKLFEPRLFRTLQDRALYQGFWNDLALFTGIVEELNLNTRIWTKR